jgi:transposase
MIEREFKGVWIPAEVWLDPAMTLTEKALLAEIDSFSGNGKSFYKSNDTIVKEYGVSKSTIARAVKKLAEMGYVDVRSDGRNRYITSRQGRVVKMTTQSGQKDVPAKSKSVTTNTIDKYNYNTLKEGGVVMPWDSKEFLTAWNGYLEMRKAQHRFSYKNDSSLQTALHQLQKMSNGSEATAIAIIAQSVAWCWKGLFPLKQNKHEPTGTTDGSLIEAHLRNLSSKP